MGVPNTTHENVQFPGDGSQFSKLKQDNLNKGDYFIDDQGNYWEYNYEIEVPWYADYTLGIGINTYYGWELKDDPKDIDRLLNKPGHTLIENQSTEEWQAGEAKRREEAAAPISIGPIGNQFNKAAAYRWPLDMIDEETDWVLFQFGKYPKPFGKDSQDIVGTNDNEWATKMLKGKNQLGLNYYNESAKALRVNGPPVMLPIPQDVANEIQQTWQGKQFTALGRAAVSAAAAGRFSDAKSVLGDAKGNLIALQQSLTSLALNTLPGVGGNISFNDLAGTTRGIVINPNAELLYDSPQMREVGMVFKMVASNRQESEQIRSICKTFRMNASPQYGGMDENDPEEWQKTKNQFLKMAGGKPGSDLEKENQWGDMYNFIRVPNLCKFTFMKGNNVHPYLTQFKPCAISNVEVNYTPDGTYTTHPDGAPIAVEIKLSFMETKVVFAQEIGAGF